MIDMSEDTIDERIASIEKNIPKLSNDELLHEVINAMVIDTFLPEGTRIFLDIKRRQELSKRLKKIGFIKKKIEI